ncbi:MAG: hypothetical protein IT370_02160 [Deltaproteobacteria bacterium]|nr:hypothetical protein [Deltaproteobacteria bacterium]
MKTLLATLGLLLASCAFDPAGVPPEEETPGVVTPTPTPTAPAVDGSVPAVTPPPSTGQPPLMPVPILKPLLQRCASDAECASNLCRDVKGEGRGSGGAGREKVCTMACLKDTDCSAGECGDDNLCSPP